MASLNPALKDFWLAPARNRVLYGGRSSSKTRDTSGFALFLAQSLNVRIMCTRQYQSSVERSVYAVLVDQIERFGMSDRFKITNTKIECPETGSEFLFFGRARNTTEIKGTEDVDIHWAEEAEMMSQEEWDIIDATLKGESSQHWIVFNPKYASDFIYQRFVVKPPADTVVRKINYDENPFLSNTQLKVIAAMKRDDPESYDHIYLGNPLTDDESVIIKRSWLDACIDAHIKLGITPEGGRRIGYDIADDGKDMNATTVVKGIVAMELDEWKGREDDLLGSCTRVYSLARLHQADIYYDCIGVGAAAGSKFKELNVLQRARIRYESFNAGGKVFKPEDEYQPGVMNKDYFANIKAQTWWTVADRMRNTYNAVTRGQKFPADQLISISSKCQHLERLKDELATPRRDFDSSGKVKVESKDDLAKRGVKSPNLADSFVMAYSPLVNTVIDYGSLL